MLMNDTIQRDIDDIRAFLDEQNVNSSDPREIVYDRAKKGFVMVGDKPSIMTNSEILAVSKILLESRAFSREEIRTILDKLVEGCSPLKEVQLVRLLIANERHHYVELHHKGYIQDKLWNIGIDIQEHNLVSFRYSKDTKLRESSKHVVEPVSILFSEYYFYLNGYVVEKDGSGKYVHKHEDDHPTIFRIDRIKNYKSLKEKFKIPYADRFEEGEFRNRIQFMYAGKLQKILMKYYGENPEPILDRLPTATIVKQTESEYIIEAEVYSKGIIMWLLSQGTRIEVLKPESMRSEMKNTLQEMLLRYC